MIQVEHLSKTYQQFGFPKQSISALKDVTLEVKKGEILAILGLNGAGKTTFIKTLLGLVRPTSGLATLFGKSVSEFAWLNRIGYLPEVFRVPPARTGISILRFLGACSGLTKIQLKERIDYCLNLVELTDIAFQKAGSYSKGMVVRLGIAQAILHQPEILILDEPTEGLDPLGKVMIRNLLLDLASKGTTIILNSHLLSEIESIAHRVAILHKGQLLRWGTLSEILPTDSKYLIEFTDFVPLPQPWQCVMVDNRWMCEANTKEELQSILYYLQRKHIQTRSIRPIRATLEEIFINHIKAQ
jgi:ABC-2 type transport system ATP-binding protein